jgi:hypothetical protein
VFVYGTARSGTTLTYSLLMASGRFPVYEAESRIMECESRYGSLRSPGNRRRFLHDFMDSRQFARARISRDAFEGLVERQPRSYAELLGDFMWEICRAQGKSRWAEKSPNNVHFVEALASYFPEARFVHVIRDGRAVVMSQREHGFGDPYAGDPRRQLIWIASVWDFQVESGRLGARLGPSRYLEIHYEDLITNFEGSLRRLERFAEVELDPSTVNQSQVGALGASNTTFDMGERGISTGSLHRWREMLAPEEIALLDWQIGDRLRGLGYDVQAPSYTPTVADRLTRVLSRLALRGKHRLNLSTPLGRIARKPLELGLS